MKFIFVLWHLVVNLLVIGCLQSPSFKQRTWAPIGPISSRYKVFFCRSVLGPSGGNRVPVLKSDGLVLTRYVYVFPFESVPFLFLLENCTTQAYKVIYMFSVPFLL